MKKYFIIFIAFILFSSCCGLHTEVKYKYKDIEILRIDECGITTFYYQNGIEKTKDKICVEYSGINDGFRGYLVFNNSDNKVELLSGDGSYKVENNENFKYYAIVADERPTINDSVCIVDFTLKYEQEQNKNCKTGVQIEYKIDYNEWW